MYLSFFLHEINILESDSFELSRKSVPNVNLPVMTTTLHIISSYNLIVCAAKNILHENQMICPLNLISFESKQAINFSQYRIRITSEMFIKIEKIFVDELKFILSDGLQDILVVTGEEEKLSTFASLAFCQVKHLPCIRMQFKGAEHLFQVIYLQ